MDGSGQFPHALDGEAYDFYGVSPEYFGYTLVFRLVASTCFEQAYCSSSGGTVLYIQQLVYVMRLR
jgi:hypothetical protein